MSERIAIVGSRDYQDLDAVRAYVRALPIGTVVVSGGARGVDQAAEEEAYRCGIGVKVWSAQWDLYGRRAGFLRNHSIVEDCTRVVAFWSGKSRGTAHTIQLAKDAGKPVEVRLPEDDREPGDRDDCGCPDPGCPCDGRKRGGAP